VHQVPSTYVVEIRVISMQRTSIVNYFYPTGMEVNVTTQSSK
jgi:hypothetical protein